MVDEFRKKIYIQTKEILFFITRLQKWAKKKSTRNSLMVLSENQNVLVASKVGTRAPFCVMSPSNSCKMKNTPSVVQLVSLSDLVITGYLFSVCGCVYVCVRVQPSYSNLCWCLAAAPGSLFGMWWTSSREPWTSSAVRGRAVPLLVISVTEFESIRLAGRTCSSLPPLGYWADDQSANAELWGSEEQHWDVLHQTCSVTVTHADHKLILECISLKLLPASSMPEFQSPYCYSGSCFSSRQWRKSV